MSRHTGRRTALLVAALVLGWTGCTQRTTTEPETTTSAPPTELGEGTVRVEASSTVAPVCATAAEEFGKQHRAVRIPITTSGTGGGFKKFVKGEIDIATASRPILKAEIDEARKNGIEFIEVPICFDAVTVVVNKENDWATDLTVEELKTMWSKQAEGKMTKWSEIRAGWPAQKVELFGPGAASGTFDYFTEAICGKTGDSRSDYVASEDDYRLVRGVAGNKYALGYFGFA